MTQPPIPDMAALARHLNAAACAVALALTLASSALNAAEQSTACETARGICPVKSKSVNSVCRCFRDPGRIVKLPRNWSETCVTKSKSDRDCKKPRQARPKGTPCDCDGNRGKFD